MSLDEEREYKTLLAILTSAGDGLLISAVVGYAIKKLMKITVVGMTR